MQCINKLYLSFFCYRDWLMAHCWIRANHRINCKSMCITVTLHVRYGLSYNQRHCWLFSHLYRLTTKKHQRSASLDPSRVESTYVSSAPPPPPPHNTLHKVPIVQGVSMSWRHHVTKKRSNPSLRYWWCRWLESIQQYHPCNFRKKNHWF